MAGIRFVVAGALLLAWAKLRGFRWPTLVEWRNATIVGGLLLLGGNGAVVWAEQWVPSGLVALLVATVPLWMVLLEWLGAGGPRPGRWIVAGIFWGLAGVGLLTGTEGLGAGSPRELVGGAVVVVGSLLWAAGSILSRHAALPASPRMSTGAQMVMGGLLLLLAAAATGEVGRFEPAGVGRASLAALAFLIVFGSLLAFSAYIWLLRATTPARVATYAYVNPVVALVLGWAVLDEPLPPRTLFATAVILSAVALITVRARKPRGLPPGEPGAAT